MSLFDKLKNENKEIPKPLSSVIEKDPSVMAAVPIAGRMPKTPEQFVERMLSVAFIKVISKNEKDSGEVEFIIEYIGEEYRFSLMYSDFELPQLFVINQNFTENEIAAFESASKALYSRMVFGTNNQRSFHLQVKLMCALVENTAGIADFSGERLFAGRWVKLMAGSDILPSAECLYGLQGVGDEKSDVWIHTHGLNRCGSIELEILNSSRDSMSEHAAVINTLAANIITKEPLPDEYEPQFSVRTPDGGYIVTTWVRWQNALKILPKITIGGAGDRTDGHNENTGVIFVYPNPKNSEKRKPAEINIYNKMLKNNPMMMISDEETKRMKALAIERFDYLYGLYSNRESFQKFAALVKIGLEVDEEYQNGDMREHIWFMITQMNEDGSFSAELTQEAYYVSAIKPGDIRSFIKDDITDWTVMTEAMRITPDTVYLLEE